MALLIAAFAIAVTTIASSASAANRFDLLSEAATKIQGRICNDPSVNRSELCTLGSDRLYNTMARMNYCLDNDHRWFKCKHNPAEPLDAAIARTIVRGAGWHINNLIWIAAELNGMCRGGSGDEDIRDDLCNARDLLGTALSNLGYCYGKRNQVGADHWWHRCTKDSLR